MSLYIKICGLSTEQDIEVALEAGVDGIGLVLSASLRQVSGERLKRLFARLPKTVERIAVLDRPTRELLGELRKYDWDGIQLEHAYLDKLEQQLGPKRAFLLPSYRDETDLLQALAHPTSRPLGRDEEPHQKTRTLAGCFLLDGPDGGGQGVAPESKRAAKAARLAPMVLAGGLCPRSVGAAITRVRPFGVDVSSGVESSRGVKDPARIQAFVQAARAAAAQLPPTPEPTR